MTTHLVALSQQGDILIGQIVNSMSWFGSGWVFPDLFDKLRISAGFSGRCALRYSWAKKTTLPREITKAICSYPIVGETFNAWLF